MEPRIFNQFNINFLNVTQCNDTDEYHFLNFLHVNTLFALWLENVNEMKRNDLRLDIINSLFHKQRFSRLNNGRIATEHRRVTRNFSGQGRLLKIKALR